MLELASADDVDALCLQELPVWALPWLDDWTEMEAHRAITRPPLWPGRLSAAVTRAHQGVFRSALAGQANAVLVARRHVVEDLGHERISGHGRERRLVQAVRLAGFGIVANLHATNDFRHPELPLAEVARARAFAERHARPHEAVVLAGDFNVVAPRLHGYSPPGPGIDHVLVRGAAVEPLTVWARERRMQNGVVLSDHAPVEIRTLPSTS
jgi:endonuclease/exonuclease/phosphatase family metal-dependent hydrolase